MKYLLLAMFFVASCNQNNDVKEKAISFSLEKKPRQTGEEQIAHLEISDIFFDSIANITARLHSKQYSGPILLPIPKNKNISLILIPDTVGPYLLGFYVASTKGDVTAFHDTVFIQKNIEQNILEGTYPNLIKENHFFFHIQCNNSYNFR